ncbi:MAG TPA: 50S ribosomal protein L19e [Candidatus Caldiarchaeum subterraneum]|uniref:Large ribosomal subunit protein eL19 n=1 Tax=Caldiarchaeum subterraneum TaxID=311458 RepID=A0A832ZWB9_CALS0|nr:50S ribosomal protein L19e [Aigarchaeota archaeon]HIQ30087.1 50S ribosomal protein L19e [Candidatus Caldarchaeum subterraneum]
MKLEMQKRIAADLLKCGVSRVRFDPERLEDIESAITRREVEQLIHDGAIYKEPKKGVSRGRLRMRRRRRGPGSRKGGKYSIIPRKRRWINTVRPQRRYLKQLRDKGLLDHSSYRKLYLMVKAGSFKSVSSLKEYIKANKMLRKVVV